MATTPAKWNATNGNWFVAAHWDEPNPNQPPPLVHHVPGASEDVSIPNNSGASTPFTVTYNGTDTVNTLAGDITGTLDITGGSLTLANGGANNSMAIDVGSGATLSVAAGTLNVTAGTYSGTLAGNGTIQFLVGPFDLNAGVSVTVANWVLGVTNNGTVSHTNLDTNLTYAGNFTLADYSGNHAVLELNGHTLTLSGTATFDGTIHGTGKVRVTGSSVHGSSGNGAPVLYGGAVLEYAAGSTAVQHLSTSLGDQASLTTGTVKIDAGATYTIDQSSSLGNTVATYAIVNNNGSLKISGASGTSAAINAQFTNTGALTVSGGNTLSLGLGASGVVNVLGGSMGGAGTLVLGGTTTLKTSNMTVGAMQLNGGNGGAQLTLGTSLTYGGAFSFANLFDTLDLNGHVFTLSGASNSLVSNVIDGPGTLKVTGAASIGGNISIGGTNSSGTAATIEDAGAMTQTGNVGLNGTLLIDAGHGYAITTASSISGFGASGATVTNNGTFTDSAAGTSTIGGTFTNTGTLAIANGATLILGGGPETLGKVSGAGTLMFGFGSNATIDSSDVTVSALTLNGGNGGARVKLGTSLTYGGAFSFANLFDTLDLNGHRLTLSGASNSLMSNVIDGPGTLKVTGAAAIGGNISIGGANSSGTAATLEDAGAMTQTGNVGLNGTLLIDAGHGYTITTASSISGFGASGATITNRGTFTDSAAGTSTLSGTFTNTGTLAIANGATLILGGGTETLGKVSGAGALVFGFGSNATIDNSAVTVSALTFNGGNGGARVTLGIDLTYGGTFSFANQFDAMALDGHTLTLSGSTALAGGTFIGKDGAVDRLTVNGANTDLSHLNFSSWEATDRIALNGTGGNDTLTGSSLADAINGHAGADTMAGGLGDDTYYVDNASDSVTEASNAGTDLVVSSVNYTLGNDVENLTLTGSANIHGTGNSLANTLTGNAGNNVLSGAAGADVMAGGAGNDTYYVDNTGNSVTEQSNAGTDLVYSSINYTLGNNVENLSLTGSAAINGTGNSHANTITGNAGNNVLDGAGGADKMTGGLGNDTFFVDSTSDVVIEADGQGIDRVFSSVSFSMVGQSLETLTLTGSANINGTGNSHANTMTGNAGNNVLDGGDGNDKLTGGLGADTFSFSSTLGASNVDTIADFNVAADTIRLDKTVFSAIVGTGTLSLAQFAANTSGTAQDADDRIIYETDTGKLFYDSNGSAAGGSTQFATLAPGLALTNADFRIV